MTPTERARSLILRGWTQDENARDADGNWVNPSSPEAVAWSLGGAVLASAHGDEAVRLRLAITEALGGPYVCTWNDAPGRTQAEVLGMLDALPEQLAIVDARCVKAAP